MRIEYGRQEDIANIRLVPEVSDGEITEDVHVGRSTGDIYLGFSADGRLLEIEILGARNVLDERTLAGAENMKEGPARRT